MNYLEFLKYVTNYYSKQHIMHKISFIVFLSHHSLKFFQQSIRAALHFCLHKYGSRPLFKRHISCEPDRCTSVVFSCTAQKSPPWKPDSNVCDELPHALFSLEKKPTFEPKLTSVLVQKLIAGFLVLCFVYAGCIYRSRICLWVSLYGQTMINRLVGR